MITPTVGRIVLYKLSESDAMAIMRRRTDSNSILQRMKEEKWPAGAQAHMGNPVKAGDVFPAIIVRTWGDTPQSCVQLQVFLDGTDTYWGSSRSCGDLEGNFQWMPYQLGQAAKTEQAEQALAAATEKSE